MFGAIGGQNVNVKAGKFMAGVQKMPHTFCIGQSDIAMRGTRCIVLFNRITVGKVLAIAFAGAEEAEICILPFTTLGTL